MIKYVLAFSIISFCYSMPSEYEYTELVFSQRSPVTAFYAYRDELLNQYEDIAEVDEISLDNLRELRGLSATTWIVHGVDGFNSDGNWLTKCTDDDGIPLKYMDMVPEPHFREVLKEYWHSPYIGVTRERNWAAVYDHIGCCVAPNPTLYFQNAIDLSHLYNMGSILQASGIALGSRHYIQHILNAIIQYTRFRPYIKCVPAEDPQFQYLFEIHLCLNIHRHIIDCVNPVPDACIDNKKIIYRDWP